MTFYNLREAAERLRRSISDSCGQNLIDIVSVDEPNSDDELGFYKLVLWCYVFWYEACPPAGRHILSILRSNSPVEHKTASSTFTVVNYLRTRMAHNLGTSRGDQHKLTQAGIWLEQHGGQEIDWAQCVAALGDSMTVAVSALSTQWELLMKSPEDAMTAVERLLLEVHQDWPPHRFDPVITEVAESMSLEGLDVVRFRQTRQEEWQKLARLFISRPDAEVAIRRIIYSEMTRTFGPSIIHPA
mgnify:CR=1 FL=1